MKAKLFVWVALVSGMVLGEGALAQVNSWSNSGNGVWKWETGSNWSLAIPPAIAHTAFITNGVGVSPRSRTVVVDATTAGSGAMAVSNLTVAVTPPGIGFATLLLNDAGATAFYVQDTLNVSGNGFLSITNSQLIVRQNFHIDSSVVFNTGTISTYFPCSFPCFPSAAATIVGNTRTGQFTMAAGVWVSGPVLVGSSVSTYGTLTIAGGSVTMGNSISFPLPNTFELRSGTFWLTGGDLTASGAQIGNVTGSGQVIISNGTWNSYTPTIVGGGTITQNGGTFNHNQIFLGNTSNGPGTVWVNGGNFVVGDIQIGQDNAGFLTISNGTVKASTVYLGYNTVSAGTLAVAGGSCDVESSMYSGFECGSTGIVNITGGSLNVTNSAGTAYLEISGGTLTISGGTLRADKIIASNACAHIFYTGGAIISTNVMLNPSDDSDGDGIQNGYEQAHNLNPLDPADATDDNDGDGQDNLAEFQAGTDATNSASAFRITSITPVTNSLRVTWTTAAGKTNALQRTAGVAGGFSTNAFTTIFTATNTLAGTTNYVDLGAATNFPSFYYRVRLVP